MGVAVGTALDEARAARRLAEQDPRRAVPAAEHALDRARRDRDPAAAAVAGRARGLALLHCGDLDSAIRQLRLAAAAGQAAGDPVLVADARITLAFALAHRGRPASALHEIETALAALAAAGTDPATGGRDYRLPVARARAQRAVIRQQLSLPDGALADFQAALAVLRDRDQLATQQTLVNRGILHAQRHDFDAAEADLAEAARLAGEHGRGLAAGIIAENQGFVARLSGDVPAALEYLRQAEQWLAASGAQLGPVFHDRSEVLLSVRLLAEARAEAERAVRAFAREHRVLKASETRMVLVQAAYLAGDWAAALTQARRAAAEFRRQGRPAWTALARLAVLRAQLAAGEPVRLRAGELDRLLAALTAAGWPAAVQESRLAAARLALDRGRGDEARALLGAASRVARRRAPAALRARGWYAAALLREAAGEPVGALRAARAGVRLLHEYGAALGATDLRVHVAGQRTELTDLGLRVAIGDGRPGWVFEWAERGRASRFRHRPVRPPDDPGLARLLAQLRATAVQLDRLRSAGRPTGRLVAAQVALERQVRDRSRRGPGPTPGWPGPGRGGPAAGLGAGAGGLGAGPAGRPGADPVSVPALARALGGRALLEFVALDGALLGLSIVDGQVRVRSLGPVADVAALLERLPFALHRLHRRDAATRAAALRLLRQAAGRLDALLLAPFGELADRELVLVPTGPLHSLPWSVLPSCAGRPVTVAPSGTLWHATSTAPAGPPAPVAVAAGPRLPGADEEARTVAAVYGTSALTGPAATAAAVLAGLDGAGLAHLAAHGRLSRENPLFSDLLLADGPLLAYDLERLPRVPHTVVLAACDAGRSLVYAGDELLGLGAAFVGRGAATLVASVVPVADARTAPLMLAVHCGLIAGRPPAVALAAAQQRLAGQDPANLAATAGFVCIGAGFSSPPLPAAAPGRPAGAGPSGVEPRSVPGGWPEPGRGSPGAGGGGGVVPE